MARRFGARPVPWLVLGLILLAGCTVDFTRRDVGQDASIDVTVTKDAKPWDHAEPDSAVAVCGDGVVESGEVCDDGNTESGDGCSGDCRSDETCGNGILDTAAGEQCDDGNTDAGDGCSPTCQVECPSGFTNCDGLCFLLDEDPENCGSCGHRCATGLCWQGRCAEPLQEVFPQALPDSNGCTTAFSNAGRKVGTDTFGNIYVAMLCNGVLKVAASRDWGSSFSTTSVMDLGSEGLVEAAVVGSVPGKAFVVAADGNGHLHFTRTLDGGATWDATQDLGSGEAQGLSIGFFGNSVYVSGQEDGGFVLYRSSNFGTDSWQATSIAQGLVYGDVLVDPTTGDLWACSDTPDPHLRQSTDGGATFGPEFDPPGAVYFSDWALGGGFIYAVGSGPPPGLTAVVRIDTTSPDQSISFSGLPQVTERHRAVTADERGTAYVCDDASGIVLRRALASDTAFDDGTTISPSGSSPVCHAAAPGTVAVAYEDGGQVFVAVHRY